MILYRITSKAHARDLSGTGAMLYGGRWNPKGIRMLYTSQSLSLATLEVVANLSGDRISNNLYCVELAIPEDLAIKELEVLPKEWNAFPYTGDTTKIGEEFVKANGLCLKVPSAIIRSEYNFLLNPLHEDFMKVQFLDARPFILDKRIL